MEQALAETIARGQRSGEISPERSAGTLARQILSTYYGLRVLARIQKDRNALLGIVDSTVSAL
ncbi:hypothetical protein ACFQ3Z_04700 [Streptomyces nogalater]